jgi:large-conductance mechanosensitive channel
MTSNTPLDFFGRQRQLVKKYGKIPKQEFRKGVEDLLSNPYNDLFFFLDTLPGTVGPEDLIRGLTSTIKKSLDSEYNLKQQQWTQSLSFQYRFVIFWSILALVIVSLSIIVYLKYLKSTKEDTKKTLGNVLAWTLFVVASSIVLLFLISFPLCRYVKSPFLSFFCSRSSWLSWLSMAILVFLVASFFSTWYFSRSFLKKDDSVTKTRMLWSGFLSVLFTVVYLGYNIYILVSNRSQISHSTSKKAKEIEEAAALLQQVKPRVGKLLQEGRSRYNAGSLARRIVSNPSKVYQILPSSLSDSDKLLAVQTAISMMEENKKNALEPLEVKRGEILKGPKISDFDHYKERMSLYRRCLIFIGLYIVLFSAYYGINLYLVHKKVGKIDQYSPLRYISIVFSWFVMSLVSLLLLYVFYNGVSNILNHNQNFYAILYIFTLPVFFYCLVLLLTSVFTLRYLGMHFSKTVSTSTRSQKIAMI